MPVASGHGSDYNNMIFPYQTELETRGIFGMKAKKPEKQISVLLLAALLALALLCGCGLPGSGSSAPKLRFPGRVKARTEDTVLSLANLQHQDVPEAAELLMQMTALEELDLGSDGVWTGGEEGQSNAGNGSAGGARDLTWEDLRTLREAAPEARFLYRFCLYGKDFTTLDEAMDLSGIPVTDEAAALKAVLPLMENCSALDMDSCGVPDSVMADLREAWPEKNVVWRVNAGSDYSFRTDAKELDLSTLSHRDVAETAEALALLPGLETVELGTDGAWTGNPPELTKETASVERPEEATRDLTWKDLHTLQDAAPQAQFQYRFRFYGRDFTTADELMDLNHSTMTDNAEAVRDILPLMKNCKKLDMDSCGVPSETMAEIRDDYPDMDVVWRIWFGYYNIYSCRTDIELMVNSSGSAGMNDENAKDLKYCTKVKRLDMGHNWNMHDWSFLSYMKDLEICIITVSGWTDINMLEGLTNLEYLEICPIGHGYCGVLDLSPLRNLTNLEHLNICGISYTSNWEVLKNLTKLKRLWIGHWTASGFPEGAIDELRAALPNTEINVTELSAATGSWKGGDGQTGPFPERYRLLREQMEYDKNWGYFPTSEQDPLYRAPWER